MKCGLNSITKELSKLVELLKPFPFLDALVIIGSFAREEAVAVKVHGRKKYLSDLDLLVFTTLPVFWYRYLPPFSERFRRTFSLKIDPKILHKFSRVSSSTEMVDMKRYHIIVFGGGKNFKSYIKKIPENPSYEEILHVIKRRSQDLKEAALITDREKTMERIIQWYRLYKAAIGYADFYLFTREGLYFSRVQEKAKALLPYERRIARFLLRFPESTESFLAISPRAIIKQLNSLYEKVGVL